ncbi:MAG: phosphoribosylanthranilate isomerase [Prevotellaceae bacterium]|jgi:phosphoribosylanthranilate isomerase|nr:phosphoribosylanthranilate isomerase [Prevotellaceae bacterium]
MIIKVCGMREDENIRAVERLDIDWMGFIFYPRSPRYVPDEKRYVDSIRRCAKKKAGVFVNADTDGVLRTAARLQLDYVQLHGNESSDTCRFIQDNGYPVVKAFSIAAADDLKQAEAYETAVSFFLFDTKCEGYGGSGRQFDWDILNNYQGNTPFLLSGGIAPGSLDDVLQFHHPLMAGVDLNSGFETATAMKNTVELQQFVAGIRRINHLK